MEEQNFDEIQEYPRWRAAIQTFLASGFKEDDVIDHQWFYDQFWIQRPGPLTPNGEAEKAKLAFLAQFGPFRDCLLREHQIDLDNVPGIGYRITPAAKQTAIAYQDGVEEVRKGMKKMLTRIFHTNLTALNAEQRKEHTDTLAKAVMMQSMVRKVRRLSAVAEIEE